MSTIFTSAQLLSKGATKLEDFSIQKYWKTVMSRDPVSFSETSMNGREDWLPDSSQPISTVKTSGFILGDPGLTRVYSLFSTWIISILMDPLYWKGRHGIGLRGHWSHLTTFRLPQISV
jgi:hypothetical protein